ncbi:MAG TPA: hypothetical protein ENK57_01215 [Polyangiaceae bacterium]|nr:hypothetical protein [Polyangiaceae bacterium]
MAEHRDTTDEPHPHLVIGTWAASLVEGRRVALLGDAGTGLPAHLAQASGRRVHAYDPDSARLAAAIAAGARRDVAYASVEEAFEARAAAFDAVVVPDLTEFDDAAAVLSGAAAMLSSRGVLILASPHESAGGGALGYYDLYDAVTAELEEVQMFGVAPFVGYAIADFAAEGEPPVTVDTALADAEEPRQYLVVACRSRAAADPYTLLQVPTAAGLAWLGGAARTARDERATLANEDARRKAEADVERLRAELDRAKEEARRASRDAKDREDRSKQLSSKLAELQTELERTRERLERRAHVAEDRAEKLQRELDASRSEYEQARTALEEAHQEDLDRMLDRIAELEAEAEEVITKRATDTAPRRDDGGALRRELGGKIAELQKALEQSHSERNQAREEAQRLRDELRTIERTVPVDRDALTREIEDDLAQDLSRLEERLKERGRVVAELTAQVRNAQRVGNELVRELARARNQRDDGTELAALEAELDTLRRTCTRQQADLEAARWQLTNLKRDDEEPAADDVTKLEAALTASRRELAELRRRLDEHGKARP